MKHLVSYSYNHVTLYHAHVTCLYSQCNLIRPVHVVLAFATIEQ